MTQHRRVEETSQRGLTVLDLLIGLSMIGVAATLFIYFLGPNTPGVSGGVFDQREAAKQWAAELNYSVEGVTCLDAVSGSTKVQCTIRVKEQPAPLSLDCNIIAKKCTLTPAQNPR